MQWPEEALLAQQAEAQQGARHALGAPNETGEGGDVGESLRERERESVTRRPCAARGQDVVEIAQVGDVEGKCGGGDRS